MAGPYGLAGLARLGPLAPATPGGASLASPATRLPGAGPESQTLLASPLADRLAGPLLARQQQAQSVKVAELVRAGLTGLARQLRLTNPKGAAQLETWAARLGALFPPAPPAPTTPAGVLGLPEAPTPGGGTVPAAPPPAPAGTDQVSPGFLG